MRSWLMAFAELWLPIIGAGICIAWAIGAWYGGDKQLAIWLIFVGVVCLLFLGTLQWQHAIAGHPEDGREQNELRRANVAFRSVVGEPYLLSNGQLDGWIFAFQFENVGPTDTKTIRTATSAHVFEGPIPEHFVFPMPPFDGAAKSSSIGPRTPIQTYLHQPIALELFQGVKAGKLHILIYARVEYTDIFEQSHWTEVCAEVAVAGNPTQRNDNP